MATKKGKELKMADLLKSYIAAGGKHKQLIWSKRDGKDYIATNHGGIIIRATELTPKELATLVEYLEQIPGEDEILVQGTPPDSNLHKIRISNADSIFSCLDDMYGDNMSDLIDTGLYKKSKSQIMKIFEKDGRYIHFNSAFEPLMRPSNWQKNIEFNNERKMIVSRFEDLISKDKERIIEAMISPFASKEDRENRSQHLKRLQPLPSSDMWSYENEFEYEELDE